MTRRTIPAALIAAAVGFIALTAAAQTSFTDDAGRKVALPARIERVLAAGPPAAVDLLILAPEKLAGLPRSLPPAALAFLPASAVPAR